MVERANNFNINIDVYETKLSQEQKERCSPARVRGMLHSSVSSQAPTAAKGECEERSPKKAKPLFDIVDERGYKLRRR